MYVYIQRLHTADLRHLLICASRRLNGQMNKWERYLIVCVLRECWQAVTSGDWLESRETRCKRFYSICKIIKSHWCNLHLQIQYVSTLAVHGRESKRTQHCSLPLNFNFSLLECWERLRHNFHPSQWKNSLHCSCGKNSCFSRLFSRLQLDQKERQNNAEHSFTKMNVRPGYVHFFIFCFFNYHSLRTL